MSPLKLIFLFILLIFSSDCSEKSNFLSFLTRFDQNQIGNEYLIFFIEMMRKRNNHRFANNFAKNKAAFKNHAVAIKRNNGFIEDQQNYKDMSYGTKPLSENGCGVIAIYNVLYHLTQKEDIDFPSIIQDLEYDGIVLGGIFGTSMKAIDDYFRKKGFNTKSSSQVRDYDRIGRETDASVLTIFNNANNIFQGIHFIAITKKNGNYYIHNNGAYSSDVAYYSITDVLTRINSGRAKNIYLTGVYKKAKYTSFWN